MAISQDIKEINTYAMSGLNSYLNLSQTEKLELLRKLISTTLAIANPSGRAKNREAVGRLVANFEDNFINFYTHEMGMSQKELSAFFANKLKDEQSILSKNIPGYKNILTMAGNVFKEVQTIQKETKGFDENTSMAELDSYLDKMFTAYKSVYGASSTFQIINKLTTVEPIKLLQYIDRSIVTIEANIAIALKHGIPVDEFQNVLNFLKQLQGDKKRIFKMTNEEIKDLRKRVVTAKRNLTIKIKQATTVIVKRIDDVKADEPVDGIVPPKTTTTKKPDDVAKFNLGKAQARFIVDNWTSILKVEDKEVKARLQQITGSEMDFVRQLKLSLDTNNDKLLEGLLKRVYKNPDMSVMDRETLIDFVASTVGRGVGILKGVIEPVVDTPVQDQKPSTPTQPTKPNTPVTPVKPQAPTNWEQYAVSPYTFAYEISEGQRKLWDLMYGFNNAGQDVVGNNTSDGGTAEKPAGGQGQEGGRLVETQPLEEIIDGIKRKKSGVETGTDGGNVTDAVLVSDSEGLTSRGTVESEKKPYESPSFDVTGYSDGENPLPLPVEEHPIDEDEVVTEADEIIDNAKKGENVSTDVSENTSTETKTEKKGFWATIGNGFKTVGKWMFRHPVLTATIGAVAAIPFAWTGALALIPKLVVYGAGALIAGNGVKAIVRAIVPPYNRFIHKYDVDKQQKKLDKRMIKRERILTKINEELAQTAVKEGVVVPDHTRVAVKDTKLNRQYDRNAERIAEAQRGMNTPVAGMDKARIKRLQGLADELNREEAAIARERQRAMGEFEKIEDIDNVRRGRTDLAEADRMERDAFARRTDMTPTVGNAQAVEVGRMGRKGIAEASRAGEELEGLLREREELDKRMRRQQGREINGEKETVRKTRPTTTSTEIDRDDRHDDTSSSSNTSSTSSSSTTSTPAGPTRKDLKREEKARKKAEKEEAAKKRQEQREAMRARKEAEALEKKKQQQTANIQKQLENEINANRNAIDEALVTSANCQDFWNKLDNLGMSGKAVVKVKQEIDPIDYANAKAQAQARLAKQVKAPKGPAREIAKKAPARPKTWQDVINQQLLESTDIEDYLNRIRNFPNMPQEIREIACRQNNIMNYDQRKGIVAQEVHAQAKAEKQAKHDARVREKSWNTQLKVYDDEIKTKKGEVDKAILRAKSLDEFKQIIANDKTLQLTEGARLRLEDTITPQQYESRKIALTETANRQAEKDENKRLKTEIAQNKDAIQEIFVVSPTLAQYQATIADMGKKGVLSQGAVNYFADLYVEKDFANKVTKQTREEIRDDNQTEKNNQLYVEAILKRNKSYLEGIISQSKNYEDFIKKIENDENFSNNKDIINGVKTKYTREIYAELKLTLDVKRLTPGVKALFDKCEDVTPELSKQRFDEELGKMLNEEKLSQGAVDKFKETYSLKVFKEREAKRSREVDSLIKKNQKTIDKMISESKNFEEFERKLLANNGINSEVVARMYLDKLGAKYYTERKELLEKQAKEEQERVDKKNLEAQIRSMSGNVDSLFKAGNLNKEQFDKQIGTMVVNGELTKEAGQYFKAKYTQDKFAERDKEIAAKNEKLTINNDVKNQGQAIKSKFEQCRDYSDFVAFLDTLAKTKQITNIGYKYFLNEYSQEKFVEKEKRINKQRTAQDVAFIVESLRKGVGINAKNLLSAIQEIQKRYPYKFTQEAIEQVCKNISERQFNDMKMGNSYNQAVKPIPNAHPIKTKVRKIWKEVIENGGGVKEYRERIDKETNVEEAIKTYLKSSKFIEELTHGSGRDSM